MSKLWKPGKPTVELHGAPRPSRIRRDPPPPAAGKALKVDPSEREAWVVVVGVILFALAIAIIMVGFSNITSK